METGGTQSPTSEAKEAKVMETNTSAESVKPLGTPYSPSSPLNDTDDESKMDWESNLSGNGIKRLFKQPPNPTEEEAREADADKVDPELQFQRQRAPNDKEPPKGAETDGVAAGEADVDKRDADVGAGASSGVPPGSMGSGNGGGEGGVRAGGSSEGDGSKIPLALKVANFLERAKEKTVTEIKTRMGRDMLIYDAISASNSRATTAMNILGAKTADPVQGAGFLDLGYGRIMSGGLQLDMTNKCIVSTSFTADWKCLRCPQHTSGPLTAAAASK
jgi:hypothetical protein